ncbi:unnamed protein product [Urochloa decumbens]|uniref:Retrovirus-related Pol polyprotein from transposon TNT 1-94-like beta-barrel domain-containing protein n=1 Tax=Urochloa decumbens TaxID=240449 RepID=A0ABC9AU59_9POAL
MGSDHEAPQGASSSPVTASVDDMQTEEPPLPLPMGNHRVLLDSGATFHATGDRNTLSDYSGRATTAAFRRRDGKDLPVAGIGTVVACDNMFSLHGVLYVPELGPGVTLVSVRQLAVSGLLVMFCGAFCYVRDAENGGSIIGKGRQHDNDGFYHLEFLRVPDHKMGAAEEERVDGTAE